MKRVEENVRKLEKAIATFNADSGHPLTGGRLTALGLRVDPKTGAVTHLYALGPKWPHPKLSPEVLIRLGSQGEVSAIDQIQFTGPLEQRVKTIILKTAQAYNSTVAKG